jgi:hypothetical protein
MQNYTKLFVLQLVNNSLVVSLALFGLVDYYPANFLSLVILIDMTVYITFLILQLFPHSKQARMHIVSALIVFWFAALMIFFGMIFNHLENIPLVPLGIVLVSAIISNFYILRNNGFAKFIDAKESRMLGLVMFGVTAPFTTSFILMWFIYPLLVLPNYLGLAFFFVSKTVLDWIQLWADMSLNKKNTDSKYQNIPRIPLH